MSFDWQTIAVALIVACALAYVARRGWARARSMRPGASAHAAASSCGNCPGGDSKSALPRPNVIVQLGRTTTPRK